MSETKLVTDKDLRALEDAIRNLWMSSDDNNKKTYDRICKWLDSLSTYAPTIPDTAISELVQALTDADEMIGIEPFEHVAQEAAEAHENIRALIAKHTVNDKDENKTPT